MSLETRGVELLLYGSMYACRLFLAIIRLVHHRHGWHVRHRGHLRLTHLSFNVSLSMRLVLRCGLTLSSLAWGEYGPSRLLLTAHEELLHNLLFISIIERFVVVEIRNELGHLVFKLFRMHALALVILGLETLELHLVSSLLTLDVQDLLGLVVAHI